MVKQTCFPLLAHVHVCVQSFSRVQLFVTPWTVARQAPLSMGFSRQKYWCGLPFPSPGDLSNSGIESGSPELQADALTSEPPGKRSVGKSAQNEQSYTYWEYGPEQLF